VLVGEVADQRSEDRILKGKSSMVMPMAMELQTNDPRIGY